MILIALGRQHVAQGHIGEGRRLIDQGNDLFEDLGMPLEAAGRIGTWINLVHDNPTLMEPELRTAYGMLTAAGEKRARSTVAAYLAEAVAAQGHVDEATRLLNEPKDISASDDVTTHVIVARVHANVLIQMGELPAAQRLAHDALTRASDPRDTPAEPAAEGG